jgi:hypothetical protein
MQKIERFRKTVLERLEADNVNNSQLIELVKEAKISEDWRVRDSTIIMGKTKDLAHFSTSFFHEAGHKILGVGGTPEEEEMCHDFSKNTCKRLNLPFDEELTNICREFMMSANEQSNNPEIFSRYIESISVKHRRLLSIDLRG